MNTFKSTCLQYHTPQNLSSSNMSAITNTYTNISINSNSNRNIFILFANNRLQQHNSDGSILQYKGNQLLYMSKKGIKNVISISQIQRSSQLLNKWITVIDKFNIYCDTHCYVTQTYDRIKNNNKNINNNKQGRNNMDKDMQILGIKIKQFCWKNPQIQQTAQRHYRVYSDCRHASVTLHKDLYIVQITYLQLVDSHNSYNRTPNMTKQLLQKYNHTYSQFPSSLTQQNSKQQAKYYYVKHKKIFTIFNISKPWRYALNLIWSSLLEYNVVPHRFCYVQYRREDMDGDRTSMPQCYSSIQQIPILQTADNNGKTMLPILGKINHQDRCMLIQIGDIIGWPLNTNNNILYDGYGFWSTTNNLIQYRKINKAQADQQYYLKAIPHIIRFENEPQRSIDQELKLFVAYVGQNQKLLSRIRNNNIDEDNKNKFDNNNTLICQHNQPNLGILKAYSNGLIIVNFVDRTLLTLNSKKMQVKIISNNGQNCYIDLSSTKGVNYQNNRAYIKPAVQFMERVFYPQQWAEKQEYNQQIQQAMEITEALQKASSTYLKL